VPTLEMVRTINKLVVLLHKKIVEGTYRKKIIKMGLKINGPHTNTQKTTYYSPSGPHVPRVDS